ncbi:hypothetical protein, partial [Actinomadura sp. HBU206391]|uniref:hypothetical protein n=1 Tax=Actinomadura sp. HBU206391 TaxID=2731692 RepID=UPI001C9BD604
TVFSQCSMRWFEASPRRANLHLPRNTTSRSSAYNIKLLSTFGTHMPRQYPRESAQGAVSAF